MGWGDSRMAMERGGRCDEINSAVRGGGVGRASGDGQRGTNEVILGGEGSTLNSHDGAG